MASNSSYRWTDPEFEVFVRKHAPVLGWQSEALWRAFAKQFGDQTARSLNQFRTFTRRLQTGSHVVPPSPAEDLSGRVLDIRADAVLVTSDHHVPYHDADLIEFALELGWAWGCVIHVLNGDVYDAGAASKFSPLLYGESFTMHDEKEIGLPIIARMSERFERTIYVLGSNHEARWFGNLLQAQLTHEDIGQLIAPEGVEITSMGFCYVNGKRVTHPGAASVVPTAVGTQISINHQTDVISAHGHTLGYRRSPGGHYAVVDTGGCFDAKRIAYLQQRDRRRPLTNQGFAIIDGDYTYLFDPRNLDRAAWLEFAKTRRRMREAAKAPATKARRR